MKGMPIVNVKIGAKALRLALDTGANKVFDYKLQRFKGTKREIFCGYWKKLDTSGTLYKSRTVEIPEVTGYKAKDF